MFLAVDIGNSDVVFGFFEPEKGWFLEYRLPSKGGHDGVFYSTRLSDFLLEKDLRPDSLSSIGISSVVPDLSLVIKQVVMDQFSASVYLIDGYFIEQLAINIERPHEIGTDLVANSVAAYERLKQALIVVDFGTALTFTAVDDGGTIQGVAILPGLNTALKSLALSTAQLPEVPLEVPKSLIGKNTIHAIQAGVMGGYTGVLDFLIKGFQDEMGSRKIPVIATGGLSRRYQPLQHKVQEIVPHLTLEGIMILTELMIKKEEKLLSDD